jgi:hypothetical protein
MLGIVQKISAAESESNGESMHGMADLSLDPERSLCLLTHPGQFPFFDKGYW